MKKSSTLVPLLIVGALFFIFGFVTWINGALIPFMRTINELTAAQSYLVASASYISFVVMAIPASALLTKIGYRKGMSVGLKKTEEEKLMTKEQRDSVRYERKVFKRKSKEQKKKSKETK